MKKTAKPKMFQCCICKKKFTKDKIYQTACLKKFCGSDCGYTLSIRLRADHAKARAKADDKRFRKRRSEYYRKDLPWQHKNTKTAFNRARVLEEKLWFAERGIEPYCISCQRTHMDFCCGHYKTVGSQGNLRYDAKNTFLQCNKYCNMELSGNINGNKTSIGYTKGLIHRFGEEEGGKIIEYCETSTQAYKWNWLEVEEIRLNAFKKARELTERLSNFS